MLYFLLGVLLGCVVMWLIRKPKSMKQDGVLVIDYIDEEHVTFQFKFSGIANLDNHKQVVLDVEHRNKPNGYYEGY